MQSLTFIEWYDSHSPDCGPWINHADISHKALKIRSIGFVIKETGKSITIASSLAGKKSSQVSGVMCIPKCAIINRSNVEVMPDNQNGA